MIFVIRIHFYVGIFLVLFSLTSFCSLFRNLVFFSVSETLGDSVTANDWKDLKSWLQHSSSHLNNRTSTEAFNVFVAVAIDGILKQLSEWSKGNRTMDGERKPLLNVNENFFLKRLMQLFLITKFPTCWCSVPCNLQLIISKESWMGVFFISF